MTLFQKKSVKVGLLYLLKLFKMPKKYKNNLRPKKGESIFLLKHLTTKLQSYKKYPTFKTLPVYFLFAKR